MLVLDLYCGAGGASVGYNRAGFDVVGVDINPQPNYPFTFFQLDAIDLLNHLIEGGKMRDYDNNWYTLEDFDFIHASPPCQSSSALTKGTNKGRVYPDLIPQTRKLLLETGLPFVIENVAGAEIRKDVTLCGEMFNLGVIRHRFFELEGWYAPNPDHIKHRGRVAGMRHGVWYEGPYFAVYGEGGGKGSVAQWQEAMDMHWTNVRKEIAEAIPPAYSEYLGRYLKLHLTRRTPVVH